MTDIDRSQFYSGGFFLIRAGHPGWKELELDAKLIPSKVVSLSRHMNQRFNIIWTWTTDNKEPALEFGIPESKWDELKTWCSDEFQKQIDIGGMFNSKQVAQQFIRQFIPDTTDLYLIEAGLPKYLEAENWREPTPENHEETGIEVRISQKISILSDGTILGFDVVGFEYNDLSCSWICSYIHRDMYELYGMKPNQYGLLDGYEDAKKIYEWIEEDEMKGTRAEPIGYDFWLVISHPLENKTENPSLEM
jgi:hypothetical protein